MSGVGAEIDFGSFESFSCCCMRASFTASAVNYPVGLALFSHERSITLVSIATVERTFGQQCRCPTALQSC